MQLSPDRLATVTAESKNLFSVSLYGHAYTGGPAGLGRTPARRRQAPIIEVVLERRDPKQGDLGWEPVAGARVAQQPERARRGRSTKRGSPRARSQDLIAKAEAPVAAQKFDQILGDPALLAVLQPPLFGQGA